jgi:hypothetical protein
LNDWNWLLVEAANGRFGALQIRRIWIWLTGRSVENSLSAMGTQRPAHNDSIPLLTVFDTF